MRLRVLGPIEAIDGDRPVDLGPPKQRLLLAVLTSRVGALASTNELVDALWGESPPASAMANLRSYVHGLRRALGEQTVVRHGRSGYALAMDDDDIDLADFVSSVRLGEAALVAGDSAAARRYLRHALELWRGRPFGEFAEVSALVPHVALLDERRLAALEQCIEADLRAGPSGDLVVELSDLVRQHPYRERFHGQLMRALHAGGRQADALAAYRAARDTLRQDLGTEPGVELRRIERAILRGDILRDDARDPSAPAEPAAAGAIVPAELPAASSRFASRDEELDLLDERTTAAALALVVPVLVVVGPGGVGKTALVVYWGHRAADRFPDGQLFVDLRGFHAGAPVTPVEALGRILRTVGVAPDRVPTEVDEAAALYRSLLSGRRMLVVLDNAASAEQVRPLLPGSAGCAAIVTSRTRMPSLAVHGAAEHLVINPLTTSAAVALLRRVLTPERIDDEPRASRDLAEACAGLPLALRIAAANLDEQPELSIAAQAARLRGAGRLDQLQADDDVRVSVRAAFDLSYTVLGAQRQRLFRLLGLIPGPDFTASAVAALAGCPVDEADRHLGRLANAHLVEDRGAGRFALHDLVREYARDRVLASEPEEGGEALGRLFEYYVAAADGAAGVLYPHLLRLPKADTPGRADWTPAKALSWFTVELPNLVAASVHAADHGPRPATAWLIADAARGFCMHRSNITDWATIAHAAFRAADAAGDVTAQAAAELSHATRAYIARDYAVAIAHYERVLVLSTRAGWIDATAAARSNMAASYIATGDLDRAAEHLYAALAINRRSGRRLGEAATLTNLGLLMLWRGQLAAAEHHLLAALELDEANGAVAAEVIDLANLIDVLVLTGRHREAKILVDSAVTKNREVGQLDVEAHVRASLSVIHRETGDAPGALRHATAALDVATPTDDRLLTGVAHVAAGRAHDELGEHDDALVHLHAARRLTTEIENAYHGTEALIGLAAAEHHADRPEAEDTVHRALTEARAGGFRVLEGQALAVLAEIRFDAGDLESATGLAEQALAIQDETGWRTGRARLLETRVGGVRT